MKVDPKIIERLRAEGRVIGPVSASSPITEGISEKQFQAAILKLAKRNGWLYFHPTISRKSQAGFPDLTMVRNGVLIFAELKVGDNGLTADQKTWNEELTKAMFKGGNLRCFVWWPSDWPTIEKVLQ